MLFIIFLVVSGFVLGVTSTIVGSIVISSRNDKKLYSEPLKQFMNTPVKDFKFLNRINDYVQVGYIDHIFYLKLDTKELFIAKGDKVIIIEHDVNKSHMKTLYDKLVSGFHKNIYEDIITINDSVVSVNQLNKEQKENMDAYIPDLKMDDILDKISEHGMDSLNKGELEFLKNNSTE